MSITENRNRIGKFTSSEIYKLMTEDRKGTGFGAPALTYIKHKKIEKKLKRSINTDVSTRPMLWGLFCERRVHALLPLTYQYTFDETLDHPKYDFISGSPDLINNIEDVVADIKCPQPLAFAELVDNLTMAVKTNDISYFKDNHPNYYYQLLSNALITGKNFIELIVYMPYESELEEIRAEVENADLEEPWKYRFITESLKCELAYLPDDSEYKNLNIFRFPLDKGDAILLESKVIAASIILKS